MLTIPMLTIRPATRDDVPVLKTMIEEFATFERLPFNVTEENLARDGFGTNPKFRVLIAAWEKHIAGYAFFFEFYSTFESRHGIFLEDIYVRPEFRGKSIGKEFFSRLVKLAQEENCYALRWQVLDWNQPAIEFYEKLGATFMDAWKTVQLDAEKFAVVAEGVR
ncbi:MAG TPA: GNAT family N-acetyltransferase [Terriglobales bacterium]|nr:GNAT family N-acetyltransferase [Terriglobales bacterium]